MDSKNKNFSFKKLLNEKNIKKVDIVYNILMIYSIIIF